MPHQSRDPLGRQAPLLHLRTRWKNGVLLYVLAAALAFLGASLLIGESYLLAVFCVPSILTLLDVAQRQIWVFENRVEIQHLFSRKVARDLKKLYLVRRGDSQFVLRMKGRWLPLVTLYGENFESEDQRREFVGWFPTRPPTDESPGEGAGGA
jgi:hypothetical protein